MFGLSLINIMWSVPEIVANQIAPVMKKKVVHYLFALASQPLLLIS